MIKGYKYFFNNQSKNNIFFKVDSTVKEFNKTMEYEHNDFKDVEEYIHFFCHKDWVNLIHQQLKKFVNKNRITLGIGSGFGEHEFLLYQKGYKIIASDVIPDLSFKSNILPEDFKIITIDIFKDNIKVALQKNIGINNIEKFDLLDSGLLFYYNNDDAQIIFQKFYDALPSGCNLILISRYRDYPGAAMLEKLLYFEGCLKSFFKKCGLIIKHHGYRRKDCEIIQMANKAGFVFINEFTLKRSKILKTG